MTNRSHSVVKRTRGQYRSRPVDPRYEIVFQNRPSPGRAIAKFFSALKSIAERGGEAVGDVYAVAARNVLGGWERVEDLNAERKATRRTAAKPSAASPVTGVDASAEEIVSTRKASV